MTLDCDHQLANTEAKLAQVEAQIERAKSRAASPENNESIRALQDMASQMRGELARYRARQKRRAS